MQHNLFHSCACVRACSYLIPDNLHGHRTAPGVTECVNGDAFGPGCSSGVRRTSSELDDNRQGKGLRGLTSECKSRCIPCSILYFERQTYANWLFALFELPIIYASVFLSTQSLICLNYRHGKDTSLDPDTGSRAMMVVVGESAWLAKAVDALTSFGIFPVHVQINHMAPIVPSPPAVESS